MLIPEIFYTAIQQLQNHLYEILAKEAPPKVLIKARSNKGHQLIDDKLISPVADEAIVQHLYNLCHFVLNEMLPPLANEYQSLKDAKLYILNQSTPNVFSKNKNLEAYIAPIKKIKESNKKLLLGKHSYFAINAIYGLIDTLANTLKKANNPNRDRNTDESKLLLGFVSEINDVVNNLPGNDNKFNITSYLEEKTLPYLKSLLGKVKSFSKLNKEEVDYFINLNNQENIDKDSLEYIEEVKKNLKLGHKSTYIHSHNAQYFKEFLGSHKEKQANDISNKLLISNESKISQILNPNPTELYNRKLKLMTDLDNERANLLRVILLRETEIPFKENSEREKHHQTLLTTFSNAETNLKNLNEEFINLVKTIGDLPLKPSNQFLVYINSDYSYLPLFSQKEQAGYETYIKTLNDLIKTQKEKIYEEIYTDAIKKVTDVKNVGVKNVLACDQNIIQSIAGAGSLEAYSPSYHKKIIDSLDELTKITFNPLPSPGDDKNLSLINQYKERFKALHLEIELELKTEIALQNECFGKLASDILNEKITAQQKSVMKKQEEELKELFANRQNQPEAYRKEVRSCSEWITNLPTSLQDSLLTAIQSEFPVKEHPTLKKIFEKFIETNSYYKLTEEIKNLSKSLSAPLNTLIELQTIEIQTGDKNELERLEKEIKKLEQEISNQSYSESQDKIVKRIEPFNKKLQELKIPTIGSDNAQLMNNISQKVNELTTQLASKKPSLPEKPPQKHATTTRTKTPIKENSNDAFTYLNLDAFTCLNLIMDLSKPELKLELEKTLKEIQTTTHSIEELKEKLKSTLLQYKLIKLTFNTQDLQTEFNSFSSKLPNINIPDGSFFQSNEKTLEEIWKQYEKEQLSQINSTQDALNQFKKDLDKLVARSETPTLEIEKQLLKIPETESERFLHEKLQKNFDDLKATKKELLEGHETKEKELNEAGKKLMEDKLQVDILRKVEAISEEIVTLTQEITNNKIANQTTKETLDQLRNSSLDGFNYIQSQTNYYKNLAEKIDSLNETLVYFQKINKYETVTDKLKKALDPIDQAKISTALRKLDALKDAYEECYSNWINFRSCQLAGVNFCDAVLTNCDFTHANFRGVIVNEHTQFGEPEVDRWEKILIHNLTDSSKNPNDSYLKNLVEAAANRFSPQNSLSGQCLLNILKAIGQVIKPVNKTEEQHLIWKKQIASMVATKLIPTLDLNAILSLTELVQMKNNEEDSRYCDYSYIRRERGFFRDKYGNTKTWQIILDATKQQLSSLTQNETVNMRLEGEELERATSIMRTHTSHDCFFGWTYTPEVAKKWEARNKTLQAANENIQKDNPSKYKIRN